MAQNQNPGQKQQQYVVKVAFTDDQGKNWSAGTTFQGDPEACKRLLAAGKLEEKRSEGQDQGAQPKE